MRFLNAEQLLLYILGGHGIITVESMTTGQKFTYRFKRPTAKAGEKQTDIRFVEILGSDQQWRYIGNLTTERKFITTRKTMPVMRDHPAVVGIKWLVDHLMTGKIPASVIVEHTGVCSKCGRKLTDPLSVRDGIGPECRAKELRVDSPVML